MADNLSIIGIRTVYAATQATGGSTPNFFPKSDTILIPGDSWSTPANLEKAIVDRLPQPESESEEEGFSCSVGSPEASWLAVFLLAGGFVFLRRRSPIR